MSRIERVFGWEAFDSRGTPTVGCEVTLAGGASGRAIVPSGASTGRHEVREVRDGGSRYAGLGTLRAVSNVNGPLADTARSFDADDHVALDAALRATDGTEDLGRLGANAILAISVATVLAAAADHGTPLYRFVQGSGRPLLPMPMVNVVSGGAHAGWNIDVQDFLVVPVGASTFAEAIEWAWQIRRMAAELAHERGMPSTLVADEGGLGVPLASNRAALELVVEAIERSRLEPGEQVAVAIDVAATQLATSEGYELAREQRALDRADLVDVLEAWCASYPIASIEDPLAEDDWDGWLEASRRLGHLQLIGDDLFATNPTRLRRGIELRVANAVLVKPNQIGTLAVAAQVVEEAREAGYATVLSARSGETEDTWLADLAVGWRTGQIKVGSITRSERTAKWNRLLQIEAESNGDSEFAGCSGFGGRQSSPPRPCTTSSTD